MNKYDYLIIKYPKIGICGLSCSLCPIYHSETKSKCGGCKSEYRMTAGCPFITCAIKKKGIEFCWDCEENESCEKWKKHRQSGKNNDSFKCYQKLEDNIYFIKKNGVIEFEKKQKIKEKILKEMLKEFNEGRSKSYYCIAATVMKINELKEALIKGKKETKGLDIKSKSKTFHKILDGIASEKNYLLKLRK